MSHVNTYDLLKGNAARLRRAAGLLDLLLSRKGDADCGPLREFIAQCREGANAMRERAAQIGPPSPALVQWERDATRALAEMPNWRPGMNEILGNRKGASGG